MPKASFKVSMSVVQGHERGDVLDPHAPALREGHYLGK